MDQYLVLVVDDEAATVDSTKRLLEKNGYSVEVAMTGQEGLEKFGLFKDELAVALWDFKLPDGEGTDFAIKMREISDEPSIIIFSCHRDEEVLHKTLRSRSLEYVYKLGTNEELLRAIDLGCKEYEKNRKVKPILPKNEIQKCMARWGITTQNEKMYDTGNKVEVFRNEKFSVLILGETGVGKEVFARALHNRKGNFVSVDCTKYSAESDSTISDLFGHEKGSFTGATERKIGLIETAHRGTLFLDELHELCPKAQRMLLRTLQNKSIRRHGGTSEISVDFRLIAAVKPNILELVKERKIIPDLYFRLRYLTIEIPPLRDRIEDIEPISYDILRKLAIENDGPHKMINKQAIKKLEGHNWIGNVRDLQGVLTAAYTLCPKATIGPSDIQLDNVELEGMPISGKLDAVDDEALKKKIKLVLDAVKKFKSIPMAARALGKERTTLHSIITRLGIRTQVDLLLNGR
jgi:DNA-binding NtrC family response regulator